MSEQVGAVLVSASRFATASEVECRAVDPVGAATVDAWDLVRAAQAGDTVAFGQLYDRYVDTVFGYVCSRLPGRDLAEDVTSETFLRALRHLGSVNEQGSDIGAWFITIARHLVVDHLKSSRFRREVGTGEVVEPDSSSPFPARSLCSPEPEQQAADRSVNAALRDCVAQLGDDQRECVTLRFLQGFSVNETAHIMNRTDGAIKALQHRAMRTLAHLLPPTLG